MPKLKANFKTLLLIQLVSIYSFSQEIVMNGTVVNAKNKQPIEFANIGILNKNYGTITNSNGEFNITIPKKFQTDSITFSHINYHPIKVLIKNVLNKTITLEPKNTELSEVVISNKKKKTKKIGVKSYNRLLSMRVVSKKNDIVEAAQLIKTPSKNIKVKAINFAIRKWSKVDGVKIRINFYKNKENVPAEKIVHKNIVIDIPNQTDSDWIRIDLNEQDIYISQDFFVGIEFIPNFEKPTLVDLGGILTKGKGYYRENSLGSWEKLNGGASINVEMEY